MRDLETMALALTAAETGHLVIATLHSQGASQNIDRIIDVFTANQQTQIRYQVSNTVQAVITQLLLRTAKGDARLPAVEVMIATSSIRNLIRESKTHQIKSVMQTSSRGGMQTMDQALAELVATSDVTLEEALTVCESPDDLRNYLERYRAPRAATRSPSSKAHHS
jgi:twitching motility protein PilT